MRPLEQFRSIVFADRALQEQLDAVADRSAFADLASEIARSRGIELSASEIAAAVEAAPRGWLLRTLP